MFKTHIVEASQQQDSRERLVNPGKSDDGVKDAVDLAGTDAPNEDGPSALSERGNFGIQKAYGRAIEIHDPDDEEHI